MVGCLAHLRERRGRERRTASVAAAVGLSA